MGKMKEKPCSMVFAAEKIPKLRGCGVIAWGSVGLSESWLYIGATHNLSSAIRSHNIIGKAQEFNLNDDIIQLWFCNNIKEAKALSVVLNLQHNPKYSFPMCRGKLRDLTCPICKTEFTQARWWQQFCDRVCQKGTHEIHLAGV